MLSKLRPMPSRSLFSLVFASFFSCLISYRFLPSSLSRRYSVFVPQSRRHKDIKRRISSLSMKKMHENFLAPKHKHELKHKFPVKEDIPQKSIHNVAIKCALTRRRITSSYDFEIVSINQRELGRKTFFNSQMDCWMFSVNRFLKIPTKIVFKKKF